MLDWLEATTLARTVAASADITAWLSAVHAVGFALVMGSALVGNLRGLGAVLPQCTIADVVRPANRAILLGLAISVATGALLFSARAADAAANGSFRLKMLLLLLAAAFQLTFVRRAPPEYVRAASAVGLSLWLGLALAACAFILLE
jgi:hypothetical protein